MFQWGELFVTVTSASVTSFLDAINSHNISSSDIVFVDDLTIKMKVKLSEYQAIRNIVKKRGDDISIFRSRGNYYFLTGILRRPVILFFSILWLLLIAVLPGRILFFQVEGNQRVSDYEILNAAQQCGIYFGTSRRHVKSEKVKNALLSQIDRLKWVGINTKGCVATISVKEGAIPADETTYNRFGNMVATSDGVISEVTVTSGNPLCTVGQAVRKGQVLISGYTDCGLSIKAEEVNGEVYAITKRNISAVAVNPDIVRGEVVSVKSNYQLQIGKNIINLKKISGILDTGCVKMYEKKDLVLPGGFCLPISLIKETVIEYKADKSIDHNGPGFDWVESAVRDICQETMLAGKILSETADGTITKTGYSYSGHFVCEEMIGKVRTEELLIDNGKGNR